MAEIQKIDLPPDTLCEIGDEQRAAYLSACGYRLIAIVPVDEFKPVSDSGTNEHGLYYSKTRQERVVGARYVMALAPESALAQSKAALNAALAKESASEQRAKDLDAEATKLRAALAKAQADVTRNCGIAESLREGGAAEAERRRKMEADIAKVRNAIGEIRMKEILAS